MEKKLHLLFFFLLLPLSLLAVKMHPGVFTVKQKDGTVLSVRAYGNEDFSYLTTTDGILLYQEGTDYYIAKVTSDGLLSSTGILAHEKQNRSELETQAVNLQDVKTFEDNIAKNSSIGRKKREPMAYSSTLLPHMGSPRVPVLLVEFPDVPFTVDNPYDIFNKYLNQEELFDRNVEPIVGRNYGSVKRYFKDMSFGQFDPQFDLYGPVCLPENLKHYGGGSASSENMNDLFKHACQLLDSLVDFSQYDQNNDGNVDLVYIIYSGYSASWGGNSTDCIHPKSGVITNGLVVDGKKVKRYGVNNELNANPEIQQAQKKLLINGIGLFVHEFSHCMGLPDIYPSTTSKAYQSIDHGLDRWSVMDGGTYTHNGYYPTAYTCWERERLGWLTIDTLSSPSMVTLKPVNDGGKAYRILNENDETGHEYYLIENIQKKGWNEKLTGNGMLVYHVDYDDYYFTVGGCRVNNTFGHPRMTLISADGIFVPEYFLGRVIGPSSYDDVNQFNQPLYDRYGGNTFTQQMYYEELMGDPFPGLTANTSLTKDTTPASWVYKGGYLDKPITDIKEDATSGTITFNFMGYADGITEMPVSESQSVYSIDGKYIGASVENLPKGIYIVNKQKVVYK